MNISKTKSPSPRLWLCLAMTFFAILLLAGSASAQFTPPPSGSQFTLEGCRNTGQVPLYTNSTLPLLCADAAYTTGNLGKGWNELDLVPFRLTATAGGSGTQTYNVYVGADFSLVGGQQGLNCGTPNQSNTTACGFDVITAPVIDTTLSDNSGSNCSLTAGSQFEQLGVTGGTAYTAVRKLTISQPGGSTCVFDWDQRLALGSHLFSGSSLQAYMFQTDITTSNSTVGKKTVPLPVNQISPQSISKTMDATQGSANVWTISKTAPATVLFQNVCDPQQALSKQIQIQVSWKKTPTLGGIDITTTISATNPSARVITVDVLDKIYVGTTATGTPLDSLDSGPVDIPANSTITILTHQTTDPNTSDTDFNDVATAVYADKLTGIPVPGNTTAAASATKTSGTATNASATFTDVENITGTNFKFSLDSFSPTPGGSVTDPSGYAGGLVTSVTFLSNSFSANGSETFTKTVNYGGTGAATGSLTDVATLNGSDGFKVDSGTNPPTTVSIAADASTTLTIQKTINPSATVSFTFHVFNSQAQEVATPTISFTAGGATTLSATVNNLQPDTYTVSEDTVTGWSTDSSKQVDLTAGTPSTCSGTASFTNSQPDGNITITPNGTNEVGHSHKFTITLTEVPNGSTPATSATITPTISPAPSSQSNTCGTVQFSNNVATCTVTINSNTAGQFTANATGTFTIAGVQLSRSTDGTGSNSGPATKTYVDANINLSPASATNPIGSPHTITATVQQNDGLAANATGGDAVSGFGPAPNGTVVTFSLLNNTANAFFVNGVNTCTINNGLGTCTVQINSNSAGSVDIHGTTTFSVGGVSLTRATGDGLTGDGSNVSKTYQASQLHIKKVTVPSGLSNLFTFTPTGWNSGATFQLSDGQKKDSGSLAPGSYSAVETVPNTFALTNIACVITGTNTAHAFAPITNGVSVTLAANEDVTCTFTNSLLPTLIVKKTIKGNSTTFNFSATGVPTNPQNSSISLTPPSNGSTQTAAQVIQIGTYQVTEINIPAGWLLTDATCTSTLAGFTSTAVTNGGTFTARYGDQITCAFVDNQQGGATRTQGFWATHTALTNAIWNGTQLPPGTSNISFTPVVGTADQFLCTATAITAVPSPGADQVLGGFWAAISKTSTGGSRNNLDQARIQLLQQYFAAVLNVHTFGTPIAGTTLANARSAYCGTNVNAIKTQAGLLGAYNTSGDNTTFTPGSSATPALSKSEANIPFWDVTSR